MGMEVLGFLVLSALVAATPAGTGPFPALLVPALFAIGFGQGLALPVLVRSIVERVPRQFAGLIAGVLNSVLQISAALSVAVIGSLFYSVLDGRAEPVHIAEAFVAAMLCIAACLTVAAGLALIARRRGERRTPAGL